MKDFIRKVSYHETDKMGITHHSNYIKWMEEARIDFLDQIGYGYAEMEKQGIISPVIAVECKYKHSTTFDDRVKIEVSVESLSATKLTIEYLMTNNVTGEVVLTGRSMHCFIDKAGRPIALKKHFPDFDKALREQIKETKEN